MTENVNTDGTLDSSTLMQFIRAMKGLATIAEESLNATYALNSKFEELEERIDEVTEKAEDAESRSEEAHDRIEDVLEIAEDAKSQADEAAEWEDNVWEAVSEEVHSCVETGLQNNVHDMVETALAVAKDGVAVEDLVVQTVTELMDGNDARFALSELVDNRIRHLSQIEARSILHSACLKIAEDTRDRIMIGVAEDTSDQS